LSAFAPVCPDAHGLFQLLQSSRSCRHNDANRPPAIRGNGAGRASLINKRQRSIRFAAKPLNLVAFAELDNRY
jgi:hypothetical protein